MSESEKSEIEKEKDAFFGRVEKSLRQKPIPFERGQKLNDPDKKTEKALLTGIFRENLGKISKAADVLPEATLLITDHDDNFPGIESGHIKAFFDGDENPEYEKGIKAYEALRDETLRHYEVDLSDFLKYIRFMTRKGFGLGESD